MAEELPSSPDNFPLCLKRRIPIAENDDLHGFQQPALALSPPPSLTTLEEFVDGGQEEESLGCSPKKPKRSNETTIDGFSGSRKDGSPAHEVGTVILDGICESVHGSDKPSKLDVGSEILGGGTEFSGEFEKKNAILERSGASTDYCELEGDVGMGVSCNTFSENQSVEFGLEKKTENENSQGSNPKVGEILELKAEVGFCKDSSEKQSIEGVSEKEIENSQASDTKISCCKNFSERKSGNFEGLLPNSVKSGRADLKGELVTCSLKIEVFDGTALVDVVKVEQKKNRRRGRKGNAISSGVAAASNGGKRSVYSRKKMEALRFVNIKGQKKFWQEVYNGLTQAVKEEYDELGTYRHHKHGQSHQAAWTTNSNGQGLLGESTSENVSCDAETIRSADFTCDDYNNDKELVGEWSGEEESDDEYDSIQRPAFWVEGEPDFESGPPEDGLEYLRRVRWEAAQIPQVKVAKIDNSKFNKEQSVYMPKIPYIEKCPPHLVPLQQWEEEFMANFSELRLDLLRLDDTDDSEPQSIFHSKEHISRSSESLASLKLPSGGPTLSAVLGMDQVTRVTMLKRRISLFDSANCFSKDDCAWLFALCAAVDTPLDADTSASLRCLLRRCAKLRAAKAELDDEVVMLNVLATISGKFFGQLDG